jgi:hypothetical protein
MNPDLGWLLAAALVVVAWLSHGWQGVLLVITLVVFWLLLQFSRALRLMRNAGLAPVGVVPSAVMLSAKLRAGLTMLQVIGLTGSLGRKLDAGGDAWGWRDEGGSEVRLQFHAGKLARFELVRPAPAGGAGEVPTPAP